MTPVASLALEAGLTYSDTESPGIRRVRRGRGFTYLTPQGRSVEGAERSRISGLAIPPAWNEVWISPRADGHILATGVDSAGRKQYLYHPEWEAIRDEIKFERMGGFGRRLAGLRSAVERDLRGTGLDQTRVVALAVAVLDRTWLRVGNRRYADINGSYGLTTLRADHVRVDGIHVEFDFTGKGGADHQAVFQDRRLAGLISRCQELAGQTLFSFDSPEGSRAISSSDINSYLAKTMGGAFTAKDFRTWGASTLVAGRLGPIDDGDHHRHLLDAIDAAAELLGNSREVCRSSYVHPLVPEAFRDGRLRAVWRRSRSGRRLDRSESALNCLLAGEQPSD